MGDSKEALHVIRIHAAWQRTESIDETTPVRTCKVSLPDLESIDSSTCFLTYVRNFNAPTGLAATDTVELECSMLIGALFINFNGHMLAPVETSSIDITALLRRHNELTIRLVVSRAEVARQATARLLIFAS